MSSVPQVRRAPSAQINFATLFEDFENSRISLVTAIANNRDRSLARSDANKKEIMERVNENKGEIMHGEMMAQADANAERIIENANNNKNETIEQAAANKDSVIESVNGHTDMRLAQLEESNKRLEDGMIHLLRTVEKDRAAHAAFREEQREQRREGPSKLVRSVRW